MNLSRLARICAPVIFAVALLAVTVAPAGAAQYIGGSAGGIRPPFPSGHGCLIQGNWTTPTAKYAHLDVWSDTTLTTYCHLRVTILCGVYPNSATYYWVGWTGWYDVPTAYGGIGVSFNTNSCDATRNLLNVDVEVSNPELGNYLTWNQNSLTWDFNGNNGVPCC